MFRFFRSPKLPPAHFSPATSAKPNSSQHCCKKVMRLPSESSSVRRMDGSPIRRGMPGKPAPVPTSTTDFPEKSASFSRDRQSRKCRVATWSGSVMAVRFITSFFSSRRAAKRSSVPARLSSSPSSRRPCVSSAVTCSAPSKGRGSQQAEALPSSVRAPSPAPIPRPVRAWRACHAFC